MLLDKVKELPHVCGIELDLYGSLSPSSSKDFLKFYNSYEYNNAFMAAYFGQKTIRFGEISSDTTAGLIHTQTLTIQFPSNDLNRAARLDIFKKVKFIKIKLNNNTEMVMGRNDYFQNKKPSVKISSNLKTSRVTFQTRSIVALGYVEFDESNFDIENLFLPADVPINFINLVE